MPKVSPLEHVQNLYVMQWKMLDLLERDLRTPQHRAEARKQMKEFKQMLSKADFRYMGGLDVWEALQSLPEEMSKKLRQSSVSVARMKKGKAKNKATRERVKKVQARKTKKKRK